MSLNQNAAEICESANRRRNQFRIDHALVGDSTVIDFGVNQRGGIAAGIELARICTGGLAKISVTQGNTELSLPVLQIQTDEPLRACMASQYAGWPISKGKYFAMGSGPFRAMRGKEEVLEKFGLDDGSDQAVGVLETGKLPDAEVCEMIAGEIGVSPERLTLACARTSSIAGTIQVVARSIETAMHKLFELGFDLSCVVSGFGSAPIPPCGNDDVVSIGWTNDAILYGGRVTLWVDCDDAAVDSIAAKLPSSASKDYGKPFGEIFKSYDYDFYKIDPMLFSPAEVTIINCRTGKATLHGDTDLELLKRTFFVSSNA